MKKRNFFEKIKGAIAAHKVISAVVILVLIGGGYYAYKAHAAASALPQYALSRARIGTITQTVTGSGQVSASNQLDVKSQVSGTIETVNAKVGDHVKAGQLLATIDSSSAESDLESSRISLAKLTQPAKASDISAAQNSVTKSYSDGYNTVSKAFLDLPTIMSGMKDLLNGPTGFLSQQHESFLNPTSRTYRDNAAAQYDSATASYAATLQEYQGLTYNSSTSSIATLINDSYATLKAVADATNAAQTATIFISTNQPDYYPRDATSAQTNISSWSNQSNGDLSSLVSVRNSIQSDNNSLANLLTGADALDIESQQLALNQKEKTYQNYFIRAPFDGIVGRIPVNVYDQASGGTVIATVVGAQKVSTISLNEIDAAKVQAGQPVMITFDAIDNFNATGTVSQIDQVGTVTQGVVTYSAKIVIDTADDRIKPGMSVNTTIITNQKPDVLVVPTSAIKTLGTKKYVQVLDPSVLPSMALGTTANRRTFSATSTDATASSTTGFNRNRGTGTGQYGQFGGLSLNVSTAVVPQQVTIVTGDSDDTNTEIISGLTQGQLVVTRTIAASQAQATAAPSILNSLGGNRGIGGGAARPGGAGGNATFRTAAPAAAGR